MGVRLIFVYLAYFCRFNVQALSSMAGVISALITDETCTMKYVGKEAWRVLPEGFKGFVATEEFDLTRNNQCWNVVMKTDDPDFLETYINETFHHMRSKVDFLFIIASDTKVVAILEDMAQMVVNVNVIVPNGKDFQIFAWSNIVGNRRSLEMVNYWSNSKNKLSRDLSTHRRSDFYNAVFKCGYVLNSNHVYQHAETKELVGIHISPMKSLMKHMGAKLETFQFESRTVGEFNETTGKWSGMVGHLMEGKVDCAMLSTPVKHYARSKVIDYILIPFQLHNAAAVTFYTRIPQLRSDWKNIFFPFTNEVWIAFALSTVVFIFFATIVLKYDEPEKFLDLLSWTSLALSGKGKALVPNSLSHFFLLSGWTLVAVLIFHGYVSSLIAGLTFPLKEKPIETWEELLDQGYTVSVEKDSFFQHVFERSTNETNYLITKVWEKMLSQDPEKTFIDFNPGAIQKTLLSEEKAAHADIGYSNGLGAFGYPQLILKEGTREVLLKTAKARCCDYYTTMPFRKTFPFSNLFMQKFLWMRDMGIIDKERYNQINRKTRDEHNYQAMKDSLQPNGKPSKLTLVHVQGMYIILLIGLLLGTATFWCERAKMKLQ